mmetsp:Transcript_15683/g.47015  ORF Transcript_15683/g.47015 Transcript_15683/m.47015 type:complete len:102 (-) Transcript_15683:10-315(-)
MMESIDEAERSLVGFRQHVNELGIMIHYYRLHTQQHLSAQLQEMSNTLDKLDHTIGRMQMATVELIHLYPGAAQSEEAQRVIQAATLRSKTHLPALFGDLS